MRVDLKQLTDVRHAPVDLVAEENEGIESREKHALTHTRPALVPLAETELRHVLHRHLGLACVVEKRLGGWRVCGQGGRNEPLAGRELKVRGFG